MESIGVIIILVYIGLGFLCADWTTCTKNRNRNVSGLCNTVRLGPWNSCFSEYVEKYVLRWFQMFDVQSVNLKTYPKQVHVEKILIISQTAKSENLNKITLRTYRLVPKTKESQIQIRIISRILFWPSD